MLANVQPRWTLYAQLSVKKQQRETEAKPDRCLSAVLMCVLPSLPGREFKGHGNEEQGISTHARAS